MQIQDIKNRLTLQQVLTHYGLKPNKNHHIKCPFHDDKNPSMRIYPGTNTTFCFSSNCSANGKPIDTIDFIMKMENLTKHEAIMKAKQLLGVETKNTQELSRVAVLTKAFNYFKKALTNSKNARDYLAKRHLSTNLEIGYNSGSFHQGCTPHFINSCVQHGLLKPIRENQYTAFAKGSLVFPLKNNQNQITSLYFRSINDQTKAQHFYLKNRSGLYPYYPPEHTKKLILTESIIDAATLLQNKSITSEYQVLATYGTNGLLLEHLKAIENLPHLTEVILWMDGDEAGDKAITKNKETLSRLLHNKI